MCKKEGCIKKEVFALPGQKPDSCFTHKTEEMVRVKNKKCKEEGCTTRPIFGKEGGPAEYCFLHKKKNMIDVVHKKCKKEGCSKHPTFGNEGGPAEYCAEHKEEEMIDVAHKKCKKEGCFTLVHNTELYEGMCFRCFMHLCPDKPVARNYKTKERLVVEFIKENFTNLNWVFDRIITGGCSKFRPDIYLELFTHVLIIEIDENQHVNYSCEAVRSQRICEDFGLRPVIFIRFNPDEYDNHKSCFKKGKDGLVKISNQKEWNRRLFELKEKITKHIENIPEILITDDLCFYSSREQV